MCVFLAAGNDLLYAPVLRHQRSCLERVDQTSSFAVSSCLVGKPAQLLVCLVVAFINVARNSFTAITVFISKPGNCDKF